MPVPTPGMNLKQYRIIDPVLTTVAHEVTNAEMIGNYLFPLVETPDFSGQTIVFDESAFNTYDSIRSPGSATKRIQNSYGTQNFNLKLDAIESAVSNEARIASRYYVDQGAMAVKRCMGSLALNLEVEQATIATNTANYHVNNTIILAGTSQFDNAASTPGAVFRDAQEAGRRQIGRNFNLAVISAQAFAGLKENAEVRQRMNYTNKDSITADILASMYELGRVVIGNSLILSGGQKIDVWGKDIILAYVNPAALANNTIRYQANKMLDMGDPSYGYTYTYTGHPIAMPPYEEKNSRSTIYGVDFSRVPVATGVDSSNKIISGFLIKNAVA